MKIVCDTNILISAFVFPGGPPEEIIQGVIVGDYLLGISDEIITELERVLHKKFFWPADKINRVKEFLARNAEKVYPVTTIKVIKDEPDNRILECAAEFGADFIVSGDKHILQLKKYKHNKSIIKIVTAMDFLVKKFV